MKVLILATVLALAALSLCQAVSDEASNTAGSQRSEAFISKSDSANAFAKRVRKNIAPNRVNDVYGAPLESHREVCELNPDCDELADHIGFHEAYRRFYGPV
ncbi:osteocalcin [Ambystoma mexicanum]|uniref:osteocalcin n=1 Tax=Ambystoma mexicanum TaxID=8296 RepID=UPI0037E8AF96